MREWWLDLTTEWFHSKDPKYLRKSPHQHEIIHVVEKSFAESLQAEIERLHNKYDLQNLVVRNENLEKENEVLRKAIESFIETERVLGNPDFLVKSYAELEFHEAIQKADEMKGKR